MRRFPGLNQEGTVGFGKGGPGVFGSSKEARCLGQLAFMLLLCQNTYIQCAHIYELQPALHLNFSFLVQYSPHYFIPPFSALTTSTNYYKPTNKRQSVNLQHQQLNMKIDISLPLNQNQNIKNFANKLHLGRTPQYISLHNISQ